MTLFNGSSAPHVLGTALGADFAKGLVEAILKQYEGKPPEELSKLRLVLNTQRMARRVIELFDQSGALLLPRITLISDLSQFLPHQPFPTPTSNIQRQLDIAPLILRLIENDPQIAPRSTVYELAASLNALLGEMHEEGVVPDDVAKLDASNESEHWKRTLAFMKIVQHYFEAGQEQPSVAARQRMILEAILHSWKAAPPDHPIMIAGSTGSRGLTSALMCAVAQLPQGSVVLPGFDFGFANGKWLSLPQGAMSEDHPQYRFDRFLRALSLRPDDVKPLNDDLGPCPERVELMSLALRPAPVTDQWLEDAEKAALFLPKALENVTLLEAPNQRLEALAIAMRLRKAAEDGTRAALITPDRTLARQVSAALDRWNIRPDDSAGEPLHLSPLGRFMRQALVLLQPDPLTAETLITLLKHPLCQSGSPTRGTHLLLTRELELYIRKRGLPYPSAQNLAAWAEQRDETEAMDWVNWLCASVFPKPVKAETSVDTLVDMHIRLTEALARGQGESGSQIWQRDDGLASRDLLDELAACSSDPLSLADYTRLIETLFAVKEVRRDSARDHPDILIWGTLEARVTGIDLLILAGLNESSWPEAPAPDPWLNRSMRARLGLLLPERRIGLSAHDFQQAASAKEIWLSRAIRSQDAETIASRWVIRLTNLLSGLPSARGQKALKDMRARGLEWIERAQILDKPASEPTPAQRPSPCPPVALRPRRLSVTSIQKLIRDPYAIYAQHILKLKPLNPLQKAPDALMRGIALHEVMEYFINQVESSPQLATRDGLRRLASEVLERNVPFPAQRLIWLARFEKLIDGFLADETKRSAGKLSSQTEVEGKLELVEIGFTLTGKADRVDIFEDGLAIYDYKSGTPASKKQRELFDKQLPLTAAMAEQGAFREIGGNIVKKLAYIGLGSKSGETLLSEDEYVSSEILAEFRKLICSYLAPDQGYTSRRAMEKQEHSGDYDHLARLGEWSSQAEPVKEVLS